MKNNLNVLTKHEIPTGVCSKIFFQDINSTKPSPHTFELKKYANAAVLQVSEV